MTAKAEASSRFVSVTERLLLFIVVAYPLLLLTLKKWMNTCLFVAAPLALIVILTKNKGKTVLSPGARHWVILFGVVFFSPVVGGLLAQIWRNEINIGHLDNLSKFLFAFPVFYYLTTVKFNPLRYYEWNIPVSVYVTAIFVYFFPDLEWGANRVTTYFVDPQSFSSLSLILGFCSLSLIDLHQQDQIVIKLFKFGAFLLGLYLSFISVSRAGWLAIPFGLALWLKVRKKLPIWQVGVLVGVVVALILNFFPLVTEKILRAVNEIQAYQWDGLNRETSVEERFTFFRIACELLKLHPVAGWGDKGFVVALNLPQITAFAIESTRFYPVDHGFHNEFFTQMVRSGLLGVIPILAVFFIPTVLFVKALRHTDKIVQGYGLLAMNYYLVVLITSISTEVYNIKFVSAFHAMTLAILSSIIIRQIYINAADTIEPGT